MPGVGSSPRVHDLPVAWAFEADDYVTGLDWSPAGELVAVGAASGPTRVLRSSTGEVHRTLPGHAGGTAVVGYSPDGRFLATGGRDGTIRLWDSARGLLLHELEAGATWVTTLAWAPARQGAEALLATAAGRHLRLWGADGTPRQQWAPHASTIADVAWKPARAGGPPRLASASYGAVRCWDPEQAEPTDVLAWKGSILALAWSANGKFLATGDQDATVHFWLLDRRKELEMSGYPTKVRELSWDAGSRYLATGGGASVTVWDCAGRRGPEGSTPIVLEEHDAPLTAVAFQRGRTFLASGAQDGRVAIWQPARSTRPLGVARLGGGVSTVRWSPDDQRLLVGTAMGQAVALVAP